MVAYSLAFVFVVFASTALSKDTSSDPCVHNVWSCGTCYAKMKIGFCTRPDKVAEMKTNCYSMCGYRCSNGNDAKGPFNEGCPDEDKCTNRDRLSHTAIKTYNITKESCYHLKKHYAANDSDLNTWIKYHCETTYGWCCPDKSTFADGPNRLRCTYKVCYNEYSDAYCLTMKRKGYCSTSSVIRNKCAWTCLHCKPPSQPLCGSYPCCWNGNPPLLIPDQQGNVNLWCPPCRNLWTHVCEQFKYGCTGGQIRMRTFMNKNCYKTCNPGC